MVGACGVDSVFIGDHLENAPKNAQSNNTEANFHQVVFIWRNKVGQFYKAEMPIILHC